MSDGEALTERGSDTPPTTDQQGPQQPLAPRAERERKVRADLWQAVWEASQYLTDTEITELVAGTLREIEADAT